MPSADLTDWLAFGRIAPLGPLGLDLVQALIRSSVLAAAGAKPGAIDDLMVSGEAAEELSDEAQMAIVESVVNRANRRREG